MRFYYAGCDNTLTEGFYPNSSAIERGSLFESPNNDIVPLILSLGSTVITDEERFTRSSRIIEVEDIYVKDEAATRKHMFEVLNTIIYEELDECFPPMTSECISTYVEDIYNLFKADTCFEALIDWALSLQYGLNYFSTEIDGTVCGVLSNRDAFNNCSTDTYFLGAGQYPFTYEGFLDCLESYLSYEKYFIKSVCFRSTFEGSELYFMGMHVPYKVLNIDSVI